MSRVWFLREIWWWECGARSVFRNILTKSRKDTPRRQKVPDTSKNFETLGKNVPLGIIICRLANTRCEPIFYFHRNRKILLCNDAEHFFTFLPENKSNTVHQTLVSEPLVNFLTMYKLIQVDC